MLFKITQTPFLAEDIQTIKTGKSSNIHSSFKRYSLTQNGLYVLTDFTIKDTIITTYQKASTTLKIYTSTAIVNFEGVSDGITEEVWNNVMLSPPIEIKLAEPYSIFSNSNFDNANSISIKEQDKRQFMLFEITNINGTVLINQNIEQGYENDKNIGSTL